MSIPHDLIPDPLLWAANLLFGLVLGRCVVTAPWRRLGDSVRQNVLFGSIVSVAVVWRIKAGVDPGLDLHLLGAGAVTLMFGPQLAVIALSVVFAAAGADTTGWQAFGVNALLTVVLPVLVSAAVMNLIERRFPRRILAYVLGNAVLGSAVSLLLAAGTGIALLMLLGIYRPAYLLSEYVPFFCMLSTAEGFLTGLLIMLLVLDRPSWIATLPPSPSAF